MTNRQDPHLATPSGKPRARSFGLPFDGEPGQNNAITDVPGVTVGYATLISGDGALVSGRGPVRTGVTAILPRPRDRIAEPVFAGIFSGNGNGELTGSHLIEEIGAFNLPITITNTHSCGVARDGTLRWAHGLAPGALDDAWALPVAGETYDGFLNDINGHHLTFDHVTAALDGASSGPIEEGSVGGGTGMITCAFKAGSGTASRLVGWEGRRYALGVFVQSNFGERRNLTVRGVRAGPELAEPAIREGTARAEKSSIIAIVATDAPLMPHQLKRIARRVPLGVAATGGYGYHSSGDIFLAFSTANAEAATGASGRLAHAEYVPDVDIDRFFDATVQATEEAILNSLTANEDMTGRDGNHVPALPKDWLRTRFREETSSAIR
ncbi:P1 family peptidase [Mesorhizobium sp. ZMM04-5]|uniref:P1 family peptidase n=1 Tax=Mesorhizobium marinum TaxID=3228790 RepID=A0ABV3R3A6_9HYPH